MPKRLAIEWDTRELRVVAASVRPGRTTVTDILSATLESNEPEVLGETLRKLLAEAGLEKLPTSVALGRGKAELRELKFPAVPAEELPEMVRFEAMRSFAQAGERSAIDFLPTARDKESVRVVAAAVGPDALKNTAMVAVPSQLAVEHLVLRPLAAASLYKQSSQPTDGEVVLVDLLADDADIVVLRDGIPIFLRSIRLPENQATRVRSLAGEIRRSLMACQSEQASEASAEAARRIVLWGRQDVHADDVSGLGEALNTQIETLDPFSLVEVDGSLRKQMPEHVGRLAPLVGMLQAEASTDAELIDFLNPRRPPEPASNRSTWMIAAVAAAVMVLLGGYFVWNKLSGLDNEIAALESRNSELDADMEKADAAIAATAELDKFLDGNVIWLAELRRVAEQLPPPEEAILRNVSGDALPTGGGRLTISGRVSEPSTVAKLEDQLRDDTHKVMGAGTQEAANAEPPYLWTFTEVISIPQTYVRELRDQAHVERTLARQEQTAEEAGAADTDADDAESESTQSAPNAGEEGQSEEAASADATAEEESADDQPADAETDETVESDAPAVAEEATETPENAEADEAAAVEAAAVETTETTEETAEATNPTEATAEPATAEETPTEDSTSNAASATPATGETK